MQICRKEGSFSHAFKLFTVCKTLIICTSPGHRCLPIATSATQVHRCFCRTCVTRDTARDARHVRLSFFLSLHFLFFLIPVVYVSTVMFSHSPFPERFLPLFALMDQLLLFIFLILLPVFLGISAFLPLISPPVFLRLRRFAMVNRKSETV